jgi:small-conductance mechanosensitive channel
MWSTHWAVDVPPANHIGLGGFMSTRLAEQWGVPTIALAALLLALVGLTHLLLRWCVRHQSRRYEAGARWVSVDEARWRRWLTRALHEVLPPAALLVWIQGVAVALDLAVRDSAPVDARETALIGLDWVYGFSVVGALFWLLWRLGGIIELFLASLSARADTSWDDLLLPLAGKTVRRALPLLAVILGAPALSVSPALAEVVRNATSLMLISVVAFILCQVVDATAAFVIKQHRTDVADNLQARAIHTQVLVLKKVALTVIGVFTLASMLMVFESVRQFGASILASAGVAGIVVGLAAQRSIATLLAGFQIALTQPIRVDDVVIVENEWGRIEDITLTYVVVRIWDQRRLIVPMTHFIERPFQNWTRSSADLLCSVILHLDYSVPVAALRDELTRILRQSRHWDGRVNVLQVIDSKEQTLEVRALASAADAALGWDLQCEVRERLVGFVQREYPDSLPRIRASFAAEPAERTPTYPAAERTA